MREPSSSSDKAAEPADDEPVWLRNRRLREAEIEAANEHGKRLAQRYGDGASRPQFAAMKPSRWRLRR
jgi:hypothetical protein